MKKIIVTIMLVATLIVCLSACEIIANQVDLTKYNDMLAVEYNKMFIQISTTTDGEVLTNKFTVTNETDKSVIDYEVEELNEISLDGANEDDYKKTVIGTVEVKDNKITQLKGEPANILFNKLSSPTFKFKSEYLENIEINEFQIKADVKKPSGFMGISNFDGTDMKVVGTFKEKFEFIKVTYTTTDGSLVEMQYTFLA